MAKDLVIIIFCAAILLFFIALDIGMLISIVRSGDERRQIIVWKASAFTLMGVTGALIIEIIENLATGQEMTMNPFVESFRSSDSYGHGLFRGAVIF